MEVERLTAELERIRTDIGAGGIDDQQRRRLRQLLYGLHAVVGLHFIKEEEIYLPELDKTMTHPEAEAVFDRMEHAATEVRRSSQG